MMINPLGQAAPRFAFQPVAQAPVKVFRAPPYNNGGFAIVFDSRRPAQFIIMKDNILRSFIGHLHAICEWLGAQLICELTCDPIDSILGESNRFRNSTL